jgi:hypothetical protein
MGEELRVAGSPKKGHGVDSEGDTRVAFLDLQAHDCRLLTSVLNARRFEFFSSSALFIRVRFAGLAATDCLLCGSEEALDDLRQHRLDGERVVGGVRHDCELVCGPQ